MGFLAAPVAGAAISAGAGAASAADAQGKQFASQSPQQPNFGQQNPLNRSPLAGILAGIQGQTGYGPGAGTNTGQAPASGMAHPGQPMSIGQLLHPGG